MMKSMPANASAAASAVTMCVMEGIGLEVGLQDEQGDRHDARNGEAREESKSGRLARWGHDITRRTTMV